MSKESRFTRLVRWFAGSGGVSEDSVEKILRDALADLRGQQRWTPEYVAKVEEETKEIIKLLCPEEGEL